MWHVVQGFRQDRDTLEPHAAASPGTVSEVCPTYTEGKLRVVLMNYKTRCAVLIASFLAACVGSVDSASESSPDAHFEGRDATAATCESVCMRIISLHCSVDQDNLCLPVCERTFAESASCGSLFQSLLNCMNSSQLVCTPDAKIDAPACGNHQTAFQNCTASGDW